MHASSLSQKEITGMLRALGGGEDAASKDLIRAVSRELRRQARFQLRRERAQLTFFRLGFKIGSVRVTLSIDDDVHHLIKAEARRTGETMGAVLSRVCREEIIKILIDSKLPLHKRLSRSSKISFEEYCEMKGFKDIIRAEGL